MFVILWISISLWCSMVTHLGQISFVYSFFELFAFLLICFFIQFFVSFRFLLVGLIFRISYYFNFFQEKPN